MLYLVSYDLKNGAPEDYQALYDEFRSFPDCQRCLDSAWLVASSTLGCGEIRDRLYAHMREGDHIIVVPYDYPRSAMLAREVVQWIRKYIT